jgi:putative flippase GtrA
MRAIVSILAATLVGSLMLQGYFAIFRPSSFGPFAEFPVILLYAAAIVVSAFVVFVVPSFLWLRHHQRHLSGFAAFVAGLVGGCAIMLLFMGVWHWPVRAAELFAGSTAGAVGVFLYAKLVFKRVV